MQHAVDKTSAASAIREVAEPRSLSADSMADGFCFDKECKTASHAADVAKGGCGGWTHRTK
eukprot:CAMPEP_0174845546 /NCGR_PEP_ID=MMETSP1114-20130205/11792_1 /TAXON_ID=312471 /ORGANISM="Neobodo designis, Strain CCAP 1951/1" /LENGTH=60 /DNA_ID=CAMNT_0016079795 /DNA_START=170 /DNA_END=352 /DNA_ORIENTATION=-